MKWNQINISTTTSTTKYQRWNAAKVLANIYYIRMYSTSGMWKTHTQRKRENELNDLVKATRCKKPMYSTPIDGPCGIAVVFTNIIFAAYSDHTVSIARSSFSSFYLTDNPLFSHLDWFWLQQKKTPKKNHCRVVRIHHTVHTHAHSHRGRGRKSKQSGKCRIE